MLKHLHYAAWAIAAMATATSLSLSWFFHLVPCDLCWYQRICMFPLVWVMGVGIVKRDEQMVSYALPLAIVGSVVAAYHTLLQWGIVRQVVPCVAAIPCATKQINWLGFITIPLMSLTAFVAIIGCLLLYQRATARGRLNLPGAQGR